MKKVLKFLAILVVFFFSVNSVSALSTDKTIVYKKTRDHYVQVQNLYTGDYVFKTSMYKLTGNGETYTAYCMDPHKAASNNYTLDRILGDSSNSIGVQAYDMGILNILKHAYTQINSSYSLQSTVTPESTPDKYNATIANDNLYAASNIAIRAFTLGLYGLGGAGIDKNYYMKSQASAHVNLGINWASWYGDDPQVIMGVTCSGQADCQQRYLNLRKSSYSWFLPSVQMHGWTYGTASYDVIYAAQELFYHGIDAAMEVYANGGANTSSVKAEIVSTVQDGKRTDEEIQEYIYANLELNGFTEEAYINNFNFSCSNCSSSGVTYDYMEYYNAENEWVSLTPDVDLSKVLEPNEEGIRSGTVRIRVHITKSVLEDEENCVPANYEITYNYFDPNLEYIGALLKDKNKTDKQRMLIIDKTDGEMSQGSIPGSIGCANAICDTELSVPICSDDEDEAISEIYAPENIKKCVLDNQDDAGNNYNLVEDSGGVSEDNAYCQVFCKEDYFDVIQEDGGNVLGGIKLNPEIEDVNCGGYFQLTAHVEGKKDCYTSGGTEDKEINREQFEIDVEQAQREMIDAWNIYSYWKAAAAKASTHDESYDSHGSCSGCSGGDSSADPPIPCSPWSCGAVSQRGDVVTKEWTFDVYTFDGSILRNQSSYTTLDGETLIGSYSDGEDASCSCCECSGYVGHDPDNDHIAKAANALEDLNTAISNYEQTIASYNSCTTNWTNEYPFEQKLSFYYSEYQGNEDYSPYYDLISATGDPDLYYLDPVDESLVEEYEIEICLDGTTPEYECEGRQYNYEEMDVTLGTYNYSQDYSEVFEHQDYIKCSESGCSIDQDAYVSNATFVKKTVKKSQDYITPTVFYQIEANGRITVNSGYTGNALTLDALINALPISTRATGGGVFKLMLEDLGEFYDPSDAVTQADNLGRLIDYGRSEVDGVNHVRGDNYDKSVAVAVGREGIETFTGDYTCYYYSDCRTEDCPDCDFVCEEGECEWVYCPDCEFDCVNCIFNLDELQINFKPISTVDVESANRDLGYNWNVNTTLEALELLRDKASLTIQEIETENETIYNKTGVDSELDFSIRLNSEIINYLKEYNGSVEDEGGYANDSLTCYSATIDGKNFANIFCYSDVLDDLYDQYEDQITFAPGRISRGQRNVDSDGSSNANANGYWSLWEGWTESEKVNGQYSVIGGPSWK